MSTKFVIAETETFRKKINASEHATRIYKKIKNYVYPQLKSNPFYGPNIKKLKGKLEGVYRYRIGAFRMFYIIDQDKIVVFILNLE